MPPKRSADSRFHFLVSPITTSMVDVEPMLQLARATDTWLRTKSHGVKLDAIVLFPIVTERSIYRRPNFIVHKRASNAFHVGRNIAFNTWRRARRPRRLRLALQNFRSSVGAIPDRHLPPDGKALILAALERAAQKVSRNAE